MNRAEHAIDWAIEAAATVFPFVVTTPSGRHIVCTTDDEVIRVTEWVAWLKASSEQRGQHLREVAEMRRREDREKYANHPGRYLTAAEELSLRVAR